MEKFKYVPPYSYIMMGFEKFFVNPGTPQQKAYEALRAAYVDKILREEVAKRFGFSVNTLNVLISRFKRGDLEFFVKKKPGPKKRRLKDSVKDQIISLRKKNFTCEEIYEEIGGEFSLRTVQRIVKEQF